MIVRLTHPQITSVRARIPELHSQQMQTNRTRANRTQSDIDLPAIAWRQIADYLKATAFGPLGGRRAHYPPSLYLAIQKIQDAINEMETHPALSWHGAVGLRSDVVPAWTTEIPAYPGQSERWPYLYSCYPNGGKFTLLHPRHHEDRHRQFTTWSPVARLGRESPVGVTHEEGFHLLFTRAEGAGVVDLDRPGVD